MWGCYDKWMGEFDGLLSKIVRCERVVFVQRPYEWRCFHFWYQPREALNSESSRSLLLSNAVSIR